MRSLTSLCIVALAGCTTVSDLRESAPFIETNTNKSVSDFAACLADQWSARSGVTNTTPRPSGMSLTLTYNIFSNAVPAATVDVQDNGADRTVTVYARAGDESDKLRGEIASCA